MRSAVTAHLPAPSWRCRQTSSISMDCKHPIFARTATTLEQTHRRKSGRTTFATCIVTCQCCPCAASRGSRPDGTILMVTIASPYHSAPACVTWLRWSRCRHRSDSAFTLMCALILECHWCPARSDSALHDGVRRAFISSNNAFIGSARNDFAYLQKARLLSVQPACL